MKQRLPKGLKDQLEKKIKEAIIVAAKEICDAHSVTVSLRHTEDEFRGTFAIHKAADYAKRQWQQHAPQHGLSEDLFGQTITIFDTDYEVIGWNKTAKKFKVSLRCLITNDIVDSSPKLVKRYWEYGKSDEE